MPTEQRKGSSRSIAVFKIHWLAKMLRFDLQLGTQMLVCRDRIIYQRGLIRTTERQIPISKITDITVQQGLMGKMFDYGNLYIETAGSPDAEVSLIGLAKANAARDLIVKLIK